MAGSGMSLGRTCALVLALCGALLAALWVTPKQVVSLLLGTGPAGSPRRTATVALRLDDVTARSSLELEAEFVEALRARRLAASVAVVPFGRAATPAPSAGAGPSDAGLRPEKLELLRAGLREGLLEVALHGHSHRPSPAARHSEFAGLPRPQQALRIAEGRRRLEQALGAKVRVFVPPWNSYDENTLVALAQLGFTSVSASANGPSPQASVLRFLPATARLRDLRGAVESARRLADPGALIVVLMHPPDLVQAAAPRRLGPRALDALEWLAAQPDVEVRTLGAAADALADLGPARLALFRQLGRSARAPLVPPPLAREYAELLMVYPSRAALARLARALRLLLVLHGAAAVGAGGAALGLAWAWLGPRGPLPWWLRRRARQMPG
jgi:hypothetical protein